jgi:prepilin peptidase CpaA
MQAMTDVSQEIVFTATALMCACAGAVTDVRERRIPNLLTFFSIPFALGCHLAFGGWGQAGWAALAGLLAGGLMLMFFLAGGMGAGDVKLMTAVGCFTGLHAIGLVLLATGVFGALFAVVLAIRHGRLRKTFANCFALITHHSKKGLTPHDELNLKHESSLRMPFALPIAAGCLVAFGTQVWGAR